MDVGTPRVSILDILKMSKIDFMDRFVGKKTGSLHDGVAVFRTFGRLAAYVFSKMPVQGVGGINAVYKIKCRKCRKRWRLNDGKAYAVKVAIRRRV